MELFKKDFLSQMNILFYLSIALTIFLRSLFLPIPIFIGDEAKLMTFGAQIVNGARYGIGFVDTRGPGEYYISAIITYFFGYGNFLAYRIVCILFQIIIIILIFRLSSQLSDKVTANLACFFYAVFSYAYILHDTVAINVEIIALPFLLASAISFYYGIDMAENYSRKASSNFVICGILTAVTFSIKQVIASALCVYFLILIYSWLRYSYPLRTFVTHLLSLTFGFLIGFLLIFGQDIWRLGIKEIWYWLFTFSIKHYNPGLSVKIYRFIQRVILMFIDQPLLWVLTFFGIMYYAISYHNNSLKWQVARLLIVLFLMAQFLGAVIAGQAVGHYFIPAIAFMSIIAGDLLSILIYKFKLNYIALYNNTKLYLLLFLLLTGIIPPILNYTIFPEGVRTKEYSIIALFSEKLYQKNDPISKTVEFINKNIDDNENIFLLGLLYDIYPLSRKLPSTIAFGINWFENKENDANLNKIYSKIIKSLHRNPPKIIILPCLNYGGIELKKDKWVEIRVLLNNKYVKANRYSWPQRLKFLSGKQGLMQNVEEWIDVYILK